MLLLIALFVTAGTLLVLNGLTLPWAGAAAPGRPARPARGRPGPRRAAPGRRRAGLDRLEQLEDDGDLDDERTAGRCCMLKRRIEQRDFAAWERLGPDRRRAARRPASATRGSG